MSSTQNGRDEDGELHAFEKNRYFHGKLMTARDMLAEQDYHGDRLAATNRYVNGEGIVCGLDVTELVETPSDEGSEVRATLSPGFALDGSGNPVVVTGSAPVTVKDPETNQPGVPAGDPPEDIDLYLRFDECDIETVPRPGSENACEEECTYNRILEVFDVVFEGVSERDTGDPEADPFPKGYKPVLDVTFPEPGQVTEDEDGDVSFDDPGLMTIAREYYDAHFSTCQDGSESWVFLGTFTDPTGDGTWDRVGEGLTHGSLVYTNDMLYAAVARHTADFHNPHRVTLDVRDEDGTTNVHVRDDESDGGDVELDSSDGTLGISGTPRAGTTSSSVDLTVDVDQVADAINAVRNIEGATPNTEGRIDLVPEGALGIRQEPGDNGLTLSVPEVDAIERIGNATPDDERAVDIGGTRGITVRTSDSQITIEGPEIPDAPEVPDLEVIIRAAARRSITCKFVSYSAAEERFSNVEDNVSSIMEEIASVALEFVEGQAFDADEYLDFIENVFEGENELNDVLSRLSGQVFTVQSVERYRIAFQQLETVLEESGGEVEAVPEIAAAQDCLTRAAEQLRPLEGEIG